MRNTFELSRLIRQNGGQLLDAFPLQEAQVFYDLVTELQQSDVSENYHFQRKYINFYKLRGTGVHAAFLNRYFSLMQNYKKPHRVDIRVIGSALWGLRPIKAVTPTQFTYLSQLLNMIHPITPVYHKYLAHFWNFKPPIQSKLEHRDRLKAYIDFYQYVGVIYQELKDEIGVQQVVKVLKMKLKAESIFLPKDKILEMLLKMTAEMYEKKELV